MDDAADRERLEALWEAHYPELLAFAFRRVGDRAAADDVVADTFLIAWRRLDAIPAEAPRRWLFAVASNVIANLRRGQRRGDALFARLKRSGVGSSSHRLDADGAGAVAHAFNRLSVRDRQALALVVWEDLAPGEAALVLGMSPARFSVRLHRAKQRLRKALDSVEADRVARPLPEPVGWRTRATAERSPDARS